MGPLVIAVDQPHVDDVHALLMRHLSFAKENTAPLDVHALDTCGLAYPGVTLFSARRDRQLLAIGALKDLDETHTELKSMHTAEAVRRSGVGRAMLDHLTAVARNRGHQWLSLETGTMDALAPARLLYVSAGFTERGPFGDYEPSPNRTFMTLFLAAEPGCRRG